MAMGCVGLVAILFVGYCTFSGGPEAAPSNEASMDNGSGSQVASDKGVPPTMTDEQSAKLDWIRGPIMQVISCSGDVRLAQSKADKVAGGAGTSVDVYDEMKRAHKSCTSAVAELKAYTFKAFAGKDRSEAQRANAECLSATEQRRDAMSLGLEIIDGNTSVSDASRYRELIKQARYAENDCRNQFTAVGVRSKIPSEALDFVAPGA